MGRLYDPLGGFESGGGEVVSGELTLFLKRRGFFIRLWVERKC